MLDTLSRRPRRTPITSAAALIGAVGGALTTLPAWAQDAAPSATAAATAATNMATDMVTNAATNAAVANAATATLPPDLTPLGMFLAASPVAQGVMVGLAAASVLTWTVALSKGLELSAAKRRAKRALAELERAGSLAQAAEHAGFARGPITDLLRAALAEAHQSQDVLTATSASTASIASIAAGIKERAASRLERIEAAAGRRMARGTGLLASIGSTAPFVGLFGTVWGIMTAFIGIAKSHTTNLAVVAPGIAEALLATAIGLVVAIPAVVLYNAFARSIGGWKAQLGDASAAILRHLSRDLDRNALPRALAGTRRNAAE